MPCGIAFIMQRDNDSAGHAVCQKSVNPDQKRLAENTSCNKKVVNGKRQRTLESSMP